MSQDNSNRSLLFGLLALHNDFITREQLVSAVSSWLRDKSKTLSEILFESRVLRANECELLEKLTRRQIERNGDDVEKTLAATGSLASAICDDLARLGDSDVEISLTHLSPAEESMNPNEATQPIDAPQGGRFRILRPHASGGLGRVSIALDTELNREVALKEIRSEHADRSENRARFVREAVITGNLEHPGIVPVYSLGHYDDGKPYYAMRFIRGDNLKKAVGRFHDDGRLQSRADYESVEFRKLLRRFVDVCNAIEYAHSRDVLHRDLKPGNVMVGKYGETLVVDWGLAKSLDRPETDQPLGEPRLQPDTADVNVQTIMGQTIGTPAYMSPEQAAGRLDQLQPTSDIYSLGATFYYLLTGRPSIQGDNPTEVLERARNGEFLAPRQLQAAIPAALESICLKAMSAVPERRYSRAVDLANDIELWLADEPVSAHREPMWIRVRRLLRKHRTLTMSVLAVLVTAVLGLAIFSAVITQKNIDLGIARDKADENMRTARRQQRRAEENLVTARAIALNILEIAEQNLSDVPGKEGFRETMMDRCYSMFQKLEQDATADPIVTEELAKVARMSGNLKRLLQKFDEARQRLHQSIDLQKTQLESSDDDMSSRIYLAETYRDLGTLEKVADNLESASQALGQAAEIVGQLIERAPEDKTLRRTQGTIDLELVGLRTDLLRFEQALSAAVRCAETYEELTKASDAEPLDPVIYMLAVGRRGQLLDRLGRRDEARDVFSQGIQSGRDLLERNPDRNRRFAFGRILLRSAEGAATEEPVPADAVSQIDEAVELFTNLVDSFPKTSSYRYYLGDCWRVRALVQWRFGDVAEARTAFVQSHTILHQLVNEVERASYYEKLAESLADAARFRAAQDQRDTARAAWRGAIENMQRAVHDQPGNRVMQQRLDHFQQEFEQFQGDDN
jgi:serine/threonine protein kinase/tetratricopeptide (TPR) repeat protein